MAGIVVLGWRWPSAGACLLAHPRCGGRRHPAGQFPGNCLSECGIVGLADGDRHRGMHPGGRRTSSRRAGVSIGDAVESYRFLVRTSSFQPAPSAVRPAFAWSWGDNRRGGASACFSCRPSPRRTPSDRGPAPYLSLVAPAASGGAASAASNGILARRSRRFLRWVGRRWCVTCPRWPDRGRTRSATAARGAVERWDRAPRGARVRRGRRPVRTPA